MENLQNLLPSELWCFTLEVEYARNTHQLVIWDLLMSNDLLKQYCNSFEFCVLSIDNAGSSYHPKQCSTDGLCVTGKGGKLFFL